jgi:hypothetical protein
MNWQTTFILGGGVSAAPVDTSRLKRCVVLGVNDASFYKRVDAYFSNDHNAAIATRPQIDALDCEKHLSIRRRYFDKFTTWNAKVWERVETVEPQTVAGRLSSGPIGTPGCSGYVALNLAAQKGARRIVLFGYDFHKVYRYFFSDEPYPRVEIAGVIDSFRRVAPWYQRRGIEILNASPGTAIDAFPVITHEQAYALA